MKKVKEYALLGVFMLMMLLLVPGKYAQATISTANIQYIPSIVSGQVIERQVGDITKVPSIKTTLQDVNASQTISLSITDPKHANSIEDRSQYYKYTYGSGSSDYYYYFNNVTTKVTNTSDGWTIVYSNIIWGTDGYAYLTLTTSNGVYYQKVNLSQMGTTITINQDNSYVPINANVKFIGNAGTVNGIQVNYNDGNGKFFCVGSLPQGGYVKKGLYDFQVMAVDANYSYYLTKQDYNINETNHSLVFEKADAGLLHMDINNTSGYSFNNSFAIPFSTRQYSRYYGVDGISKPIYVTKMNYNFMSIANFMNNGWCYQYRANLTKVTDDSTSITLGTKLSLKYVPSRTTYSKNDYFYDVQIQDEYSNIVEWIYDPSNQAKAIATLTDANGVNTSITTGGPGQTGFQLPNIVGTYTLSFVIYGSLIPITTLTPIKITISDNSSGPLQTPQGLMSNIVSANEVDLSWYNYQPGVSYNVYRATSIDGEYVKVGSSYSSAYFDTNVSPNTNYWYKVSMTNNVQESELSSPLSVSTGNTLSSLSKISFLVPDINHESYVRYNDVYFNGTAQGNSNSYTNGIYLGTPYVASTNDGWMIHYSSDQLKNYSTITAFIHTSKYMYVSTFNQTAIGTVISLRADSTCSPISVSIPFADGSLSNILYEINYIDQNGNKLYAGSVYQGEAIPAGKYDIEFTGIDNSYAYSLLTKGVQISNTNNTLNFDRNNIGILKTNINDTSGKNLILVFIQPLLTGVTTRWSTTMYFGNKKFDSIYLNKGEYSSIMLGYQTSDYWMYNYQTLPLTVNDNNASVTVDSNLKAYINLPNSIYYPDNNIDFGVKDGLNNRLNWISVNNGMLTGGVEFKDANGNVVNSTSFTNNGINPVSPYIKVPNINGTFDVVYTINGSEIPIAPATSKIVIGGSGTQVPGTPPNLAISRTSANSIRLSWDVEAGATYYNIYRSFNGGVFVLVGNSTTNNFTDNNLHTGNYQYYVRAANDSGEGSPTGLVAYEIVILGDVNDDGSVDIKDYELVKQFLLNVPIPTTYNIMLADVDGDNHVTSKDLAFILRYIFKK